MINKLISLFVYFIIWLFLIIIIYKYTYYYWLADDQLVLLFMISFTILYSTLILILEVKNN